MERTVVAQAMAEHVGQALRWDDHYRYAYRDNGLEEVCIVSIDTEEFSCYGRLGAEKKLVSSLKYPTDSVLAWEKDPLRREKSLR